MWEGKEEVEWRSCYSCKVWHREVMYVGAIDWGPGMKSLVEICTSFSENLIPWKRTSRLQMCSLELYQHMSTQLFLSGHFMG